MTLGLFLIIVFAVGAALAAYAVFAPSRRGRGSRAAARSPQDDWVSETDDEFAGLSDAARCEMVFAIATLDDESSRHLLQRALEDPAEAVAMAAAHALATSGRVDVVRSYARLHPGERARLLLDTMGWMADD